MCPGWSFSDIFSISLKADYIGQIFQVIEIDSKQFHSLAKHTAFR